MNAFERARPWLEAALAHDDERPLWTIDDVRADVEQGRSTLWSGERSCVLVSRMPFGRETLADGWLAGGELDEIMQAIPRIEDWARIVGCTQAHIAGRRGWERALRPLGYDHYATTVRKLL